ncbi:MAG: hypothetical protein K2W96_17115 [Gemmataceae bacterium]|nr:hypothetical protein [Gemmataceae bacterium]
MDGKTGQPQNRYVFGFADDTEREVEASSLGEACRMVGVDPDDDAIRIDVFVDSEALDIALRKLVEEKGGAS